MESLRLELLLKFPAFLLAGLLLVSCTPGSGKHSPEAAAGEPTTAPKFDPGKGEDRIPPRPSIFSSDPEKPGFVGFPFQNLPIPAGAFELTLSPTDEVVGQTRVSTYVITSPDRGEWDTTKVSEFLLAPKGKIKRINFGSAPGGKKSDQTIKVPFEKGDKFIIVIADLPGRFTDSGGTRDDRMEIIELEMDYTDPLNPVGGKLSVKLGRNSVTQGP